MHSIYIDITKVFDKVSDFILLNKLSSYRVSEPRLQWFSLNVTERTGPIKIVNYSSIVQFVPSGVPQCSILGPLLFSIGKKYYWSLFSFCGLLKFLSDINELGILLDIKLNFVFILLGKIYPGVWFCSLGALYYAPLI